MESPDGQFVSWGMFDGYELSVFVKLIISFLLLARPTSP